MYSLFSFSLAVIPAVLLLRYFYKQDNLKKEPKKLIVNTFLLGIIVTVPVIIIEFILMQFNNLFAAKSISFFAFKAFVVAAFTEELLKLIIVYFYAFRKKAFDEVMDGIVYTVTASLGFACLENILYVMGGGMYTAVVRAFTAIPLHALAAGIMGYYVGEAKFAVGKNLKMLFLVRGLVYAISIHGLYDFMLFLVPIAGNWTGFLTLPLLYISYKILMRKIKTAKSEDVVMQRV
jgi:protease PrsW